MSTSEKQEQQPENAGLDTSIKGLLLGLCGVTIFGATVPATSLAVADLDPWFITFGRATVAASLAVIVIVLTGKRLPRKLWAATFFGSLCLVIGFPGFIGLALVTLPASHSGVVLGLFPIATAIMAVIIAGERPSRSFWFWSVLGAILVTIFAIRDGTFGLALGDIFLVCAVILSSAGYAISGMLSRQKPGWEVICWQLIMASPVILIGVYFFWDSAIFTARPSAQAGFAYVSLFSMFIGFFVWNKALAIGGIARVGQTLLIQPFVTLAISALVLGEKISLETYAFAAAIVMVVWFSSRARAR
ncbi:MAG: DMT family transporter [Hyphomicrobiales bacterium]